MAWGRNNHRLDGISDGFKVFADPVDSELSVLRLKLVTRSEQIGLAFQRSDVNGLYHREDASNILTNDPTRSDVANNAQHFWPEVAGRLRAPAKSAGYKPNGCPPPVSIVRRP